MKLSNMSSKLTFLCIAIGATLTTAQAQDARSMAMGNTGIITGKGAAGALLNPALLAKHKDQGLRGSFLLGTSFGLSDQENLQDDLNGVNDIIDVLNDEADKLEKNTDLNANCPDINAITDDNIVCATGLTGIRTASRDAIGLLKNIDGKPLDVSFDGRLGFSYVGGSIPFAMNTNVDSTVTVYGELDDADEDFLNGFIGDSGNIDNLTIGDIKSSDSFSVENGKLVIEDDYEAKSSGNGALIANSTFAVSLAKKVNYNDDTVYLGLAPKYVASAYAQVDADANVSQEQLQAQIDDSQSVEDNYSLDAGVIIPVPESKGFSIGATVTDIAPYSIEVNSANSTTKTEINTEAQATVGLGYEAKYFNVTTELAVNPAQKNGVETRPVSIGAEAHSKWFGVRAGVSHDLARKDSISYSVGVDLGFIEVGAKVSDENSAEVSTQISFDF